MNNKDTIAEAVTEVEKLAEKMPCVLVLHNMQTMSVVWMSSRGLAILGVSAEEIEGKSEESYHSLHFNPEDAKDYVPKLQNLIECNDEEKIVTFFQQVRASESQEWQWYMSSAKIFKKDTENKPLLVLSISIPIDPHNHITAKVERLLEENNFLRKHLQEFSKLSERECEVLRLLALGKSASDTAEELCISTNTVESHRKNIKQKLNTNSFFELCQYARAFDLI
ncbi:LuxR C-terminal-related transcriptional regulator [Rufibacter roseus]|uniref:LuxR C-terminal-related transcriptional regulator n=1 Tax=Rufibacter roseus TaxID=1567108 RepID=A0ABW2DR40_9BACT|nr:LuxR C-terminal-related transcriptional regulator [Rufibacter roseus]